MTNVIVKLPEVGDRVRFFGVGESDGTISHVWSYDCVNVDLDTGETRTSVRYVTYLDPNAKMSYACVPLSALPVVAAPTLEPEEAPALEPGTVLGSNAPALFAFGLTQPVRLSVSGEQGVVVGRAEYTTSEPGYLVRYRDGTGRAVEAWWSESALTAV